MSSYDLTTTTGPNDVGRRLIVAGGLVGLAITPALGILLTLSYTGSRGGADVLVSVALFLFYVAPYALAFIVYRVRPPQIRGALALSLALLALCATMTSISLITLILLPSALILFAGAALSLRPPIHSPIVPTFALFIFSLIGAAMIMLSFLIPFWTEGTVHNGRTLATYPQALAALCSLGLGIGLFLIVPKLYRPAIRH